MLSVYFKISRFLIKVKLYEFIKISISAQIPFFIQNYKSIKSRFYLLFIFM